MATAVTHAVFSFGLGQTFLPVEMPWRFWACLIVCSILPDTDVITFSLGLPYSDFFGHRGFSHSLLSAFLLGLWMAELGPQEWGRFSKSWWALWLFCSLLNSAHGLLDALTDGGLGVAFLSPFDNARYFLPLRPLRVSPIGVGGFFSPWGREVIISEVVWVWIPTVLLWAAVRGYQKAKNYNFRRTHPESS